MNLAQGIYATANALGISPIDLATVISYETSGTMDPMELGQTTKYGQHQGLIQFGEPQAEQFGVSFETPQQAFATQLGDNSGIYNYLKNAGVQPGMGLLQLYSAINTGGVDNFFMKDEAAGGMPGTVADKVAGMGDHRAKAIKFMESVMNQQPLNASPLLGANNTGNNEQPTGMNSNPLFGMINKATGGGLDQLKKAITGEDADASDRLAIGLMSLSGNPQQLQPLMQMAAQDIQDRKKRKLNNKSLEYIRNIDPELARLAENNPALMQNIMSSVMSQQLKGKKTIMSSAEILSQFGQTVPDGTYEVTVGRDNKPTDISPINPKTTDPTSITRIDLALKDSSKKGGNYGAAVQSLAKLDLLEGLLDVSQQGFLPGLAQFTFENFGIDTRSDTAAAAAAIINQIVPEMRPPGSGPMSDADLAMFKASAPSIAAKPGGNKLIIKTLRGLAKYERDFAEIHQNFASGVIETVADRDKAIRALEDPMKEAAAWMKANGIYGSSPEDDVTVTDEEIDVLNQ